MRGLVALLIVIQFVLARKWLNICRSAHEDGNARPSRGLSDAAATRINTSSAAGCGTGTRTASSGSPARSLV
jgi:hypothetical protein